MASGQFQLLATRRFVPLFVTQALGAFDDNVLRNAIAIVITFQLTQTQDLNAPLLVNIAAALFIAPFFLFSALAGQLADKIEKGRMTRAIKMGEIAFALIAAASLFSDNAYFMLSILFLSGTLATFFGPIKYGILPQHLREDELIGGNAMIETGTFLAILLGLLFGGLVIGLEHGPLIVSATMIGSAIIGYLVARAIPNAPPPAPDLVIDWHLYRATAAILRQAATDRIVLRAIIGISWFWAIGAVFVAQFPAFTFQILGADAAVSNLLLAAFTVGIGLGSLLCNLLLKGVVSARLAPAAALGLTLFALDLVWASSGLPPVVRTAPLIPIGEFLSQLSNWRILGDLIGMALCGGVFVVPLYALMQAQSAEAVRSRIVAAANVMNAVFMTVATGVAAILIATGLTIHGVFFVFGIVNLAFAVSVITIARRRVSPT
ncbi:MFS family permease [Rhodoligotrophos appendicifer]|uniref:MFS transporter n=1 Tax=Rhodoligotrophos appendicifer TaxID=987056 RepID=UPI001184FD01|nr:MFS transporter [Rhodoligotrophos appendicifer]